MTARGGTGGQTAGVGGRTAGVRTAGEHGAGVRPASELGVFATVRRGVRLSPQMVQGIWLTLGLAVLAALGKVLVPMAVQLILDHGLLGDGGPDGPRIALWGALAAIGLIAGGGCSCLVELRLLRATEDGLAALRVQAFGHVHALSATTQGTERRGALVSRVTGDVDTISQFVQRGGITLVVSVLQVLAATVLMAVYSWRLTLVVWATFVPFLLLVGPAQRRLSRAYLGVRVVTGRMMGAISEAVVGAETIAAYGVQERARRRITQAVDRTRDEVTRTHRLISAVFSSGVLVANLTVGVVVVAGTLLGVGGELTAGRLLAFLFLVNLFTGPIQMATEVLNELQNAVAGWRRVIAVLETPLDIVDAGPGGAPSPRGAATVELQDVSFAYPGGPEVLGGISLTLPAGARVALVGETGSGKTTLAKIVARLLEPRSGRVLLDGVDLRDIALARLRERCVVVPQEGFLFDGTIRDNIVYGLEQADPSRAVYAAVIDLGLGEWLDGLPEGLETDVGQRGENLSAGERQLVALARAYVTDPDLLVLDEATSAVDPGTEARIARALDRALAGRTTLTVAHRLSTARAADLVIVMDRGRVAGLGAHDELLAGGGPYADMYAAWAAQSGEHAAGSWKD